ncbi:hypothetical protein [Williamsia sp.]|uniref:hypothetical protein n=1 Tax=Williamsia sp. TaxID=1872085 RepID=UPI002F92F726
MPPVIPARPGKGRPGGDYGLVALLGEHLFNAIIAKPLSYLLSIIFDGEPEDWDTLDEIQDGFGTWLTSIESIPLLGDFFELITGVPDSDPDDAASWIKDKIDDLFGKHETVAGDIEELEPQVVHVQQMIDVRSNRGLNEGPDPTAESSFDFEVMALPVAHAHAYTATGGDARTTASSGVSFFEVNATTSRWAFIRCWRDDPAKSVLSWMSWRAGAVTSFYLDVYRMEEDGSYTWIASTDNLAGELTTVQSWMQFEIPTEVITTPGTVIGIQFRASHPVNISGVEFPAPLAPWGFRPTSTGGVRAASDAPSTLSTLTMDNAYNGSTPFVQFGSDVGQVDNPRSFYDDFSGGIQDRFWKKRSEGTSNTLTTEGGAAAIGGPPSFLFTLQAGIYTRPLLTDHMAIEFTVLDPHSSSACGVFLSSNWDMNEFVMLSVESDRAQLWTGNGTYTADWTTQVTHTISTGASSVWKLEYKPLLNRYVVSRNGTDLFAWTDSTNIVSHGRGRRFGGLMVTSQISDSGRIDNFNFYDVV